MSAAPADPAAAVAGLLSALNVGDQPANDAIAPAPAAAAAPEPAAAPGGAVVGAVADGNESSSDEEGVANGGAGRKLSRRMVRALLNDDPASATLLRACTQVRRLLSVAEDPPIQPVIAAGLLPRLLQLLTSGNQNVQFECAWIVTNIAGGSSAHVRALLDAGFVPALVALLSSPYTDTKEQAVWALGNISGDSSACRDLVLATDTLPLLLGMVTVDPNGRGGGRLSLMRVVSWALANLCRGKPAPAFRKVSIALPTLVKLLTMHDAEVLTDACWCVSYLSDDRSGNRQIEAVVASGATRYLVDLLQHESSAVQVPALRAVGQLVTGSDEQTQVCLNCGLLPQLLPLLSHPRLSLRKESCMVVSNITAGTSEQIQSVIDAELLPPLMLSLQNSEEPEVQKEALWAISNATSSADEAQTMTLVEHGAIEGMCAMLTNPDSKLVMVALNGIENILVIGRTMGGGGAQSGPNLFVDLVEACGGVDAIEKLQAHPSEEVYTKAAAVLTEMGAEEEDEEQQEGQ